MLSVLYELGLWMLALLSAPKMLYLYWRYGKYRHSLRMRLGFDLPSINKGDRKLVWIHAVSMGETKAIAALAKKIKSQPHPPLLVISSLTETGHAEAKRSLPFADYHLYLPFDFYFIIAPIVKKVAPDCVLLSETDLWYNFLRLSKAQGAKIALVNGKISERSTNRLLRFPRFAHALYSLLDRCCVQNEEYRQRFEKIGVPADKLFVTGNLKLDETPSLFTQEERNLLKLRLGIPPDAPVVVLGSTHHPEEDLLLNILDRLWIRYPKLKVILVPRHPERFLAVSQLLSQRQVPYVRFTELTQKTGKERVILIDAMGMLRQCYQIADIAIVCGSYTPKVGGHNVVEPCAYGVPVLFGPYMHTQEELLMLVKAFHAGLQVPLEELENTLIHLLDTPQRRQQLGEGGLKLVQQMRGATEKSWEACKELLKS